MRLSAQHAALLLMGLTWVIALAPNIVSIHSTQWVSIQKCGSDDLGCSHPSTVHQPDQTATIHLKTSTTICPDTFSTNGPSTLTRSHHIEVSVSTQKSKSVHSAEHSFTSHSSLSSGLSGHATSKHSVKPGQSVTATASKPSNVSWSKSYGTVYTSIPGSVTLPTSRSAALLSSPSDSITEQPPKVSQKSKTTTLKPVDLSLSKTHLTSTSIALSLSTPRGIIPLSGPSYSTTAEHSASSKNTALQNSKISTSKTINSSGSQYDATIHTSTPSIVSLSKLHGISTSSAPSQSTTKHSTKPNQSDKDFSTSKHTIPVLSKTSNSKSSMDSTSRAARSSTVEFISSTVSVGIGISSDLSSPPANTSSSGVIPGGTNSASTRTQNTDTTFHTSTRRSSSNHTMPTTGGRISITSKIGKSIGGHSSLTSVTRGVTTASLTSIHMFSDTHATTSSKVSPPPKSVALPSSQLPSSFNEVASSSAWYLITLTSDHNQVSVYSVPFAVVTTVPKGFSARTVTGSSWTGNTIVTTTDDKGRPTVFPVIQVKGGKGIMLINPPKVRNI